MLYLGKRGLEEIRILFPVVLDDLQQNLLLLLLLITVSPSCSLSTVIYNCHVGHQTFIICVLGSVTVPHREQGR